MALTIFLFYSWFFSIGQYTFTILIPESIKDLNKNKKISFLILLSFNIYKIINAMFAECILEIMKGICNNQQTASTKQ